MTTNICFVSELAALLMPVLGLAGAFLSGKNQAAKFLLFGHVTAFIFALACLFAGFFRPATMPSVMGQGAFLWRLDFASSCLLLGITFITAVIVAFSERYLGADGSRLKFLCSVSFLSVCASCLAVTDNIVVAFICWNMLSFGLWKTMLLQKTGRQSASVVLKHHLFSDAAMLAALAIVCSSTGVTAFSQLPAALAILNNPVTLFGAVLPLSAGAIACSLLVLAFSIKSALFPFHRWLLATLDAPTPLSGLLHAGVVNVSAIMAWRLMPMLQEHGQILLFWGCLAALSAIVGTLSMSAQPDVKRKLVYSTVGQMGFMCLQCASGAVGAALFHLLAHGLFKCQMFLQSGSAVVEGSNKRKYGFADGTQLASEGVHRSKIAILVGSIVFSAAFFTLGQGCGLTGISAAIAACAVFCALPALPRVSLSSLSAFWTLTLGLALAAGYACARFEQSIQFHSSVNNWLLPSCLSLFATISIVLQMARKTRLAKALYVHSLNGFYIDEISAGPKRAAPGSL